jgi:hypothetical protein
MQRELTAHRYSFLAELASMANAVAMLARSEATALGPVTADTPKTVRPAEVTTSSIRSRAARVPKQLNQYPRFERDGDRLIKIGWSKKAREQYEHRAPRDAVVAFVQSLSNVKLGATFAIESLLPIADVSGEELPSYQVYLVLAWLRSVGLIEKKGRDGYVMRTRPDQHAIDSNWEELPKRMA